METLKSLSAFSLPPGFGFHPTDAELISHYLKRKILGLDIELEVIPEVDIYKHEPWDLPAKCHIPTRDSKWHFFNSRDRKYPNGFRTNRATEAGYWKSTGKDRNIRSQNRVVGTKKTLVFHEGRPPCGKRTDWIMHEYYIDERECKAAPGMKDAYVLCRVTKRNGMAPEGENFPTKTEEVDDCPKQPKDVAAPVAIEETSSPSETVEDYDAWFLELMDPNFIPIPTLDEIKSEPKEGLGSLGPKQEPVDSYVIPEVEDPHLFISDDIYNILHSDSDNFNSDIFTEFDIGTRAIVDHNFPPKDDYHGSNFRHENSETYTDAGIHIRERRVRPSTGQNHRIKLQVSKMESRNGGSITQTFEIINHDLHLQSNEGKQSNLEPKSLSTTSKAKKVVISKEPTSRKVSAVPLKAGIFSSKSCIKGIIRSVCNFSSCCSSASMNCFFLGACMMGTAALISYFLVS